MTEWRDVPGFEGCYKISIRKMTGECLSVERFKKQRWFKEAIHERILSNHVCKGGRIFWALHKDGKQTTKQAAVWIALTYPELVQNEWFPGAHIDHIDTNTLNNHPSNLRWVERWENQNNPITKIHMSISGKGKHGKTTIQIKDGKTVAEYQSLTEAFQKTGINLAHISLCCNGKRKTAGGFSWSYKEKKEAI